MCALMRARSERFHGGKGWVPQSFFGFSDAPSGLSVEILDSPRLPQPCRCAASGLLPEGGPRWTTTSARRGHCPHVETHLCPGIPKQRSTWTCRRAAWPPPLVGDQEDPLSPGAAHPGTKASAFCARTAPFLFSIRKACAELRSRDGFRSAVPSRRGARGGGGRTQGAGGGLSTLAGGRGGSSSSPRFCDRNFAPEIPRLQTMVCGMWTREHCWACGADPGDCWACPAHSELRSSGS